MCLFVRCFINSCSAAISATVVPVFIYIMKMEEERLSATLIPTYGLPKKGNKLT